MEWIFFFFLSKSSICVKYICIHPIVDAILSDQWLFFFVLDPWCRNGVEGRIVNSGLTELAGGGVVINGATHSSFSFFYGQEA